MPDLADWKWTLSHTTLAFESQQKAANSTCMENVCDRATRYLMAETRVGALSPQVNSRSHTSLRLP
jgi:hypothetical protein